MDPIITIDWSFWQWFIELSTAQMAVVLFGLFGWIIMYAIFFKAGADLWFEYRKKTRGQKNWHWVLLAVDIPDLFIQTPKAVEQIFAHLSGAHSHITVKDKYWGGATQRWFSFEIVSIEGYIQFLIRTEAMYRDLVEASIYAQYTAAEITEVEDYVNYIPSHYPNSEVDILGVDFKLSNKDPYSLRTYRHFEYNLSKDAVFSDPMAAILENFTRIGHGENLWMEIIIEPTDNSWKEEGISIVKELMAGEAAHHESLADKVAGVPMAIAKDFMKAWSANWEEEAAHGAEKKGPDVSRLSPGKKTTIEAVEEKIAKVGFKTKVRILYAAKKEVFNPSRCIDGFVGSLNQFNVPTANGLVPHKQTHEHYDNKHHKRSNRLKNTFIKAYKDRKIKWKLKGGYILNIEELATIWHFPLPFVKAPLVSKAGAKRGEPPVNLPVEMEYSPFASKKSGMGAAPAPEKAEVKPPPELPYG